MSNFKLYSKKIIEFITAKEDFFIILAVAGLFYIHHLLSFRLGMNFEECRDANAYLLSIKGSMPFRDFQWIYGPFAFFVYPFIMKIFGVNLIVLRTSYIIFASLVIPLIYFLARRIMPAFWAGVAAFLSIIFFHVPYYTYNHIFIVLGGISCLLMIAKFIETDKRMPYLFLAGVFCSISVMAKPLITGAAIFAAVSLFILLPFHVGNISKRFKDFTIFAVSVALLPIFYCLYFFYETGVRNIVVSYPYFAPHSSLSTDQSVRIKNVIPLIITRASALFPIKDIMNTSSIFELKRMLAASFDSFILFFPFIIILFISGIIIYPKFCRNNQRISRMIPSDTNLLFLLSFFSILISLESLMISHVYSRAFIMQIPFVICAYILYFIKTAFVRRRLMVNIFIVVFLFYLSFLNFFRYPFSNLKKYEQILNLERAGGVLVTEREKELYESLSIYLEKKLGSDKKIAIIGYLPQLSFLSNRENILGDDEYIFLNLRSVLIREQEAKSDILASSLLENRILSKMERQKPKIVLAAKADYLTDYTNISPKINAYLRKNYSLDQVFIPAPILGREDGLACLHSYKLK